VGGFLSPDLLLLLLVSAHKGLVTGLWARSMLNWSRGGTMLLGLYVAQIWRLGGSSMTRRVADDVLVVACHCRSWGCWGRILALGNIWWAGLWRDKMSLLVIALSWSAE
jgi:hypothetical protein